jgi:hypothetical protein
MVRPEGTIQDLLTDKSKDIVRKGQYKEWNVDGANDFEEWTVIEAENWDSNKDVYDDIIIIEDEEALWQGIVGCLHTPKGYIDGVTLENYGSKLLSLRGVNLSYEIAELAKVYIRETIPQYQGYVKDFPKIEITLPKKSLHERFNMQIYIEVDSVFGRFSRTTYI